MEEIQGSEEDIARAKCQAASELAGGQPIFTEDVSLRFHALGGLPGPYIKWFWGTLGCEGLHTMLQGFEDKRATAVCTYAFCPGPGKEVLIFQGEAEVGVVSFSLSPPPVPAGPEASMMKMKEARIPLARFFPLLFSV